MATATKNTTPDLSSLNLPGVGKVSAAKEVPGVTRGEQASVYSPLFAAAHDMPLTEDGTHEAIVLNGFEDNASAATKAGYIRRISSDDIEVKQRGKDVYVRALTASEVTAARKASKAKADA